MPNRAGGRVMPGGAVALQVQKGSTSPLRLDLWYSGRDRFHVVIRTPLGRFGPYPSPATNDDASFVQEAAFTLNHQGAERDFFNATNGKRELLVDFSGPAGVYTVGLQGAVVRNGRFDATLNPSFFNDPNSNQNRFLTFVAPGSIWDGATARFNIAPNSYVIRNEWVDIDGVPRAIVGEGEVGDLWREQCRADV